MAEPREPTLWIPLCYDILLRKDLGLSAKLLHAYLYSFRLAKLEAFPAIHTIADNIGISKRQAQYAIRELESIGALRVERRLRSNGSQASNHFFLTIPQDSTPRKKKTHRFHKESYNPRDIAILGGDPSL